MAFTYDPRAGGPQGSTNASGMPQTPNPPTYNTQERIKARGRTVGEGDPRWSSVNIRESEFTDPFMEENKARLARELAATQQIGANAQAAQMAGRDRQAAFIAALQQQAAGGGPSLVAEQARAAQGQNVQAAMAAQAAGGGGGLGQLAQRAAAGQQVNAGGDIAQAAMMGRLGEQGELQQSLGQQLAAMRGQDTAAAQQQSQLDAISQKYMDLGFGLDAAQYRAMQDMIDARRAQSQGRTQLGTKEIAAHLNKKAQHRQANAQFGGSIIGTVGAGLAALSDRRAKTGDADGGDDVDDMLDELKPRRFRYKDEAKHGRGERLGIMAQDAEKSSLGKRLVREIDGMKALDVGKSISAVLAATARLNERLRKVEGRG